MTPSRSTSTAIVEARHPSARSATAGPSGTTIDEAAMDSATDRLTKRLIGGSNIQLVALMTVARRESEAMTYASVERRSQYAIARAAIRSPAAMTSSTGVLSSQRLKLLQSTWRNSLPPRRWSTRTAPTSSISSPATRLNRTAVMLSPGISTSYGLNVIFC